MAIADPPFAGNARPGPTSQGRAFHAFPGWTLVPAADLLLLRHALERRIPSAGPDPAADLLRAVEREITRRAAPVPAPGE